MSSGGPGEKKRRDLIEELYKTEELFVENLKLVYEVKPRRRESVFNRTFLIGFCKIYKKVQSSVKTRDFHFVHQLEGLDHNEHQVAEVLEDQADHAEGPADHWRYSL